MDSYEKVLCFSGFRVLGSGCRVPGTEFRVPGRFWGSGRFSAVGSVVALGWDSLLGFPHREGEGEFFPAVPL